MTLIALIATAFSASAAQAPVHVIPSQQVTAQCAPEKLVLGYLADKFNEHVLWLGDTSGGVTVIVTQAGDASTWTLLAVHAGVACMVSSGGSEGAGRS